MDASLQEKGNIYRLKELKRENQELKRANEILWKASAYFAQAGVVYGRLQFAKWFSVILV